MPIDDLFAANRDFLRTFKGPIPEVFPRKKLAVVACIDNRLVGVLPPALGLTTGDAMLIRVAGVQVTPTQQSIVRSVAASIYFSGVREVAVVGHTDCRMAVTEGRAIEAMKAVGIDPDQACAGRSPRQVLGLIPSPEEAVRDTVEALRQSPLIPPYVEICGMMIDSKSAEVTEVTRSPAMGTPPEEAAPAPSEDAFQEHKVSAGSPERVTIGEAMGASTMGGSSAWAGSTGSMLGSASGGRDAFASAGPIGPIGPSTPLGSGSSSSGLSGVDAFISLGSTPAFRSSAMPMPSGRVIVPEPPSMPGTREALSSTPGKEAMKDLMDSMSQAMQSALLPTAPLDDGEIPTAILLDDPSTPPASAKPGFTFDKEELRRRRDEKIKRIIKGS